MPDLRDQGRTLFDLGGRQGNRISVSFEFFPPASDAAEEGLWQVVSRLAKLSPDFVSVTYGAGGSTQDRSIGMARRILGETSLDVASHLTCVGASRSEVDDVVRMLANLGVKRIVALRGDSPSGVGTRFVPHPEGYSNAADLVSGISRLGDFDIAVSAYPEKHPESPGWDADIAMLKRKQDNGASRAITQFFFDNDLYEAYLERARKAGVTIPIVPGILPIHHFGKVAGFAARCGASIPAWLAERFDGLDEDPETRKLVAAAIAAEQVGDPIRRGVEDFHFYTMNRAELTLAVCRLIGIRERLDEGNPGDCGMAA